MEWREPETVSEVPYIATFLSYLRHSKFPGKATIVLELAAVGRSEFETSDDSFTAHT